MVVLIVIGARGYTRRIDFRAKINTWIQSHETPIHIFTDEPQVQSFSHSLNIWSQVYPIDWDTHGKSAGSIRNQTMIDAAIETGEPVHIIAFPDLKNRNACKGTWNLVTSAMFQGIPQTMYPIQ